jgi:hypothetical protein
MITEGDRLNRNPEGGTKKIRILLPEDAWHKVEAEWLWGELIEDSIYALRNTPFYALGLSYDDRVKVDDVDGNLTMLGVVSRGGHSTYRIFAKKGDENSRVQALFRKLHDLHCGIEATSGGSAEVTKDRVAQWASRYSHPPFFHFSLSRVAAWSFASTTTASAAQRQNLMDSPHSNRSDLLLNQQHLRGGSEIGFCPALQAPALQFSR